MWRVAIALSAAMVWPAADGFRFELGSPVAAGDFHAKTAAFVVRTANCADLAAARVAATAEGLVNGDRRSINLKLAALATPGVYAVFQTWPADGVWVVSVHGTCAAATAGVIVPIGPQGFVREAARFLARPATAPEITDALRALSQERAISQERSK